jgi:hypothetical protein
MQDTYFRNTTKHLELILVFLVSSVLIIARMPNRVFEGYLWAEDGPIFLKAAFENGASSIFTPYAGYLSLTTRLIAYLQSTLQTPV